MYSTKILSPTFTLTVSRSLHVQIPANRKGEGASVYVQEDPVYL